jgi:hypothetical protein
MGVGRGSISLPRLSYIMNTTVYQFRRVDDIVHFFLFLRSWPGSSVLCSGTSRLPAAFVPQSSPSPPPSLGFYFLFFWPLPPPPLLFANKLGSKSNIRPPPS